MFCNNFQLEEKFLKNYQQYVSYDYQGPVM